MEVNSALSNTEEKPDASQREVEFTHTWVFTDYPGYHEGSDHASHRTISRRNNTEDYLGDFEGNVWMPRAQNKADSLFYHKHRIGGSVESVFSQSSVQNAEWSMLKPSKSQDALSMLHSQRWRDNKPVQCNGSDVVDDVVGDEVSFKYPGQSIHTQNTMDSTSTHLKTPPSPSFTPFYNASELAVKTSSIYIAENLSNHRKTQNGESHTALQSLERLRMGHKTHQEPGSCSLFTGIKENKVKGLESLSEQHTNSDYIESSEELDSNYSQAAKSNRSQDVSVPLLKSILTEKEVKINNLSKDLRRIETENLHLVEERDQLLSEIEAPRSELEVITFDKERKKQQVLNSFDPNSPAVLRQQIANLKTQITDLQEANENVVLELAKADEEISQQKKDMAKLKAEYNYKLGESREEIKSLSGKLSHMPNTLNQRGDYELDMQREIFHLRSECRRLRIHTHQLSEQNHRLQEELRDVKRQTEGFVQKTSYSTRVENDIETERLQNDSFNKGFNSSDWNSEEKSLYRNDAFKVDDGTFSKCKTAVSSLNIKGSWEQNHEGQLKNSPSPLSMTSENTDILMAAFHEGTPQKSSPSGGLYEEIQFGSDSIYPVTSKENEIWNSIHKISKSEPVRIFSDNATGRTGLRSSALLRRPFAPKSVADLKVGNVVKFSRAGGKLSKGTIQYKGHLCGREEVYLGVELEGTEVGKHDGTFQGARYFLCKPNKGVFVHFNKIIMAWE